MSAAGPAFPPLRWAPIAAVWCGLGLFEGTRTVLVMRSQGMHHAWLALFAFEVLAWLPWALATPWIVRVTRRREVGGRRASDLRALLAHLARAMLVCAVSSGWSSALQLVLQPWRPDFNAPAWRDGWPTTFVSQSLSSLILYAGIVVTTALLDGRERLARQQVAAARMADQLAQARLAALRHQIEPHFLFNALNSISGLVRCGEADAAADMIARLSGFLRTVLQGADRQEVSLAEELALTRHYLEIQRLRYGERLRVLEQVADAAAGVRVPMLILQPLVENAVRHGIDRLVQGGTIEIRARRDGDHLCLDVRNDGPALPVPPTTSSASVGLANVRARLDTLYGAGAGVALSDAEGGGVLAAVRMPWRELADA